MTLGLGASLPFLVRRASPRLQEATPRALAVSLLGYILVGLLVRTRGYGFSLSENLPLHLCGATLWLGAVMLWRRSYRLYEVVYFWGTGGSLSALLTPDLQEGFPGPLFLLFFIGHGFALLTVAFATIVWGFRPRCVSLGVALAATAGYALLIYPVNRMLGSNYLYLAHKPDQPSPLDYLGSGPAYVLGLGTITVAVCLLCYAPFALASRLARPR